ncbi:unnamed protein product [Linum tenue]|uniref:Uncharacterized protein n=1 Tax=Linum tenue TaxID=586396 RepID=A0AAV0MZ45_9ROSI|nr:unnamed protein product [Linum tenue]
MRRRRLICSRWKRSAAVMLPSTSSPYVSVSSRLSRFLASSLTRRGRERPNPSEGKANQPNSG